MTEYVAKSEYVDMSWFRLHGTELRANHDHATNSIVIYLEYCGEIAVHLEDGLICWHQSIPRGHRFKAHNIRIMFTKLDRNSIPAILVSTRRAK